MLASLEVLSYYIIQLTVCQELFLSILFFFWSLSDFSLRSQRSLLIVSCLVPIVKRFFRLF